MSKLTRIVTIPVRVRIHVDADDAKTAKCLLEQQKIEAKKSMFLEYFGAGPLGYFEVKTRWGRKRK